MGLGIHVFARVMGLFAIFCPCNKSCFFNLAPVMYLLYRDLPGQSFSKSLTRSS